MDELTLIRKYYLLDREIDKLKRNNYNITPQEVYSELLKSEIINLESDSYGITIGQAQQLDNDYFRLGGNYWIRALEKTCDNSIIIEEGTIKTCNGYKCVIYNGYKCEIYNQGIFTCDLRIHE